MPSQLLIGNSCLLTKTGWHETSEVSKDLVALGVNRFGQVEEQPVSLSQSGDVSETIYIGTKSAFGAFHPDTLLLDGDGATRSAGTIVQNASVGELRFEHLVSSEDIEISQHAIDQLWLELTMLAVAYNNDQFLIPTRSRPDSPQDLASATEEILKLGFTENNSGAYAIATFNWFESEIRRNWREAVPKIGKLFFHEDGENWHFDRRSIHWCNWIVLILDMNSKINYELVYDNLQHSSIVKVEVNSKRPQIGLVRGATAYVRRNSNVALNLEWADPSWNPVISGFLLARN